MAIIFEKKVGPILLGGKPVRVNRYKDREILVFNKLKEHWQAEALVTTSVISEELRIDGGRADSTYTARQLIDGEGA